MVQETQRRIGEECSDTMCKLGFGQGNGPPCTFYHASGNLSIYLHGDDSVTVGKDNDLKLFKEGLVTDCGLDPRSPTTVSS